MNKKNLPKIEKLNAIITIFLNIPESGKIFLCSDQPSAGVDISNLIPSIGTQKSQAIITHWLKKVKAVSNRLFLSTCTGLKVQSKACIKKLEYHANLKILILLKQ